MPDCFSNLKKKSFRFQDNANSSRDRLSQIHTIIILAIWRKSNIVGLHESNVGHTQNGPSLDQCLQKVPRHALKMHKPILGECVAHLSCSLKAMVCCELSTGIKGWRGSEKNANQKCFKTFSSLLWVLMVLLKHFLFCAAVRSKETLHKKRQWHLSPDSHLSLLHARTQKHTLGTKTHYRKAT